MVFAADEEPEPELYPENEPLDLGWGIQFMAPLGLDLQRGRHLLSLRLLEGHSSLPSFFIPA